MDNHLHVLVRLDGEAAKSWSAEEVARRWTVAHRPKSATGEETEVVQAWIDHQAKDEKRVELLRQRLTSLGWFMKALKEPLARMANKEDACKGTVRKARLLGSYLATDRGRLQELARQRGLHHLDNLAATTA